MLFQGICVILLFAISIATFVILIILVRNLVRDFKKGIVDEVKEAVLRIAKMIQEKEQQDSGPVLEKLDEIIHHGLIPMKDRLEEIGYDVQSLLWDPPGHGSSYMTGAEYMTSGPGHAIHVYRNGGWELQEDFSKSGYEASPPSLEGSYPGQVVKTVSRVSP